MKSKYTIYVLDELELDILTQLEQEPRRFKTLVELNQPGWREDSIRQRLAKMQSRALIWSNVNEATFMITHAGIANARAYGRKGISFPQLIKPNTP